MNIAEAITAAVAQLEGVSDSPRLDAELLLCEALKQSRTYLFTWPERELTPEQSSAFQAILARRKQGEPVAHILERRAFWTLDLRVSADTLIPRPETELLVEAALARLSDAACRVLDLGTGSGAIALALASERPHCELLAVEQSEAALRVAEENAKRHGIENVRFLHGSWYDRLENERFELIVTNPPYICVDDPHLDQGDVKFEPISALASGDDGLDDIRHIIAGAMSHLLPGGWIMLEHGYDQGDAVCALLRDADFQQVEDIRDLQGHGRVAMGCRLDT